MNAKELSTLMTDTESLAFRAGRERAQKIAWMQRARQLSGDGNPAAVSVAVEAARDAHKEYLRLAVKLRTEKAWEAQRREDYRQTLRQY